MQRSLRGRYRTGDGAQARHRDHHAAYGGSSTITLPTALTAGTPYDVTATSSYFVYTCFFGHDAGASASGVVSGPVTLTLTCYRNNC
jgi:hypothetical protein